MSLKPKRFPDLPEDTAHVARGAFRKGNIYLTMGDRIHQIFQDEDFADLYALCGAPGLTPAQVVLVLIFQALENLSDREAADAVRSRIDWKYALHLPLAHAGFDFSVLSEFRDRLVEHEAGERVLDRVLERLRAMGLLKERGRQRTDSTYVFTAARTLNRLELVMETVRVVLEELAVAAPVWLQEIAQPHWVERYSLVWRGSRLPKSQAKRAELAASVGEDGAHLLQAMEQEGAPEELAELQSVQILQKVWEQQYEEGPEGWQWRPAGSLPPAKELIQTPHDLDARYSHRKGRGWTGYQVHFTETCDPDRPRLVTHVALTPAWQPDVTVLDGIHQGLKRRGCLPGKHLVDGGYMAGHTLVESQEEYGVELVGPVQGNTTWQAKQADGFTPDKFQIDWAQKQAICPEGQRSNVWWPRETQYGHPVIYVRFPAAHCQACPSRSRCTQGKSGRSLGVSAHFQTLEEARERQGTEAFRAEYAPRAGVEGTISEAVRTHGARRSRYIGQEKTALQEIFLATAINLERSARWLMGNRPAPTRTTRFTALSAAA
jgi:transposase